jgi:thioredoxin 1
MNKFSNDVLTETKGKFLVKVGAAWCEPCKTITPVLNEVSEEGYQIFTLDIDDDMSMATKYGIRSVPTFLVFENGELLNQKSGLISKIEIIELLN